MFIIVYVYIDYQTNISLLIKVIQTVDQHGTSRSYADNMIYGMISHN